MIRCDDANDPGDFLIIQHFVPTDLSLSLCEVEVFGSCEWFYFACFDIFFMTRCSHYKSWFYMTVLFLAFASLLSTLFCGNCCFKTLSCCGEIKMFI